MTLLNLVDQTTNELDNKQFSLGIFIDLSKAFDMLDHEILISKLNHYGIRGTANKSIGIIQRVSYNLSTCVLLSLYYTMIHPYYEYCNIIWANVKSKYLEKLSTFQRKVLRIVFKLKWSAHVDRLYVKCNILNIYGINSFQIGCLCLKL